MKIRIIDLLNKIANNEEVPKKIKYNCEIFERVISGMNFNDYVDEDGDYLFQDYDWLYNINDEIEIIEEDKKIETINNFTSNVGAVDDYNIEEYIHKLFEQEFILFSKINEIIDYINKGDM